jgi:hypothetical protein
MSLTARLQKLLEHRWLRMALAVIIGPVSLLLLWETLQRDYYEYWVIPKLKAADVGLYIYPQLRYTLFDIVILTWGLAGLIAAGLLLWNPRSPQRISGLLYRTLVIYFALFIVLILGGTLMLHFRSRGF